MTDRPATEVAIVRAAFRAMWENDLAQIEELVAEDCVLVQSPSHPRPGRWTGRTAVLRELADVFSQTGASRPDVTTMAGDGAGTVFVEMNLVLASGTVKVPVLELYRLRDDKIVELRPYLWNPNQLLAPSPTA